MYILVILFICIKHILQIRYALKIFCDNSNKSSNIYLSFKWKYSPLFRIMLI